MADFRPPCFAQVLVPEPVEPPAYVPPPDWTLEAGEHCLRPGDYTPCVDGEEVGRWTTSATHNLYVGQDSGGQRPHYHTAGLAGHPYVEWDGSNDVLFSAAWTDTIFDATYFLVIHPQPETNLAVVMSYYPKPSLRTAVTDGDPTDTGVFAAAIPDALWHTPLTPQLLILTLEASHNVYRLRLNNTLSEARSMWAPPSPQLFMLGGETPFSTGYYKGRIYEICRYPGILTDSQRDQVRDALNAKYAIW